MFAKVFILYYLGLGQIFLKLFEFQKMVVEIKLFLFFKKLKNLIIICISTVFVIFFLKKSENVIVLIDLKYILILLIFIVILCKGMR